MAPIHHASKPLKSALKKPSSSSLAARTAPSSTSTSSLFPSTKRDKRHIKHAALLSKISKPTSKNAKRRRRPNKKLVATLNSLAAALPDDQDATEQGGTAGAEGSDQVHIIRRKSMKSRPGAMKRREKLDLGERERFAKNMAQMAVSAPPPPSSEPGGDDAGQAGEAAAAAAAATAATSQRWAALRGFIAQTLEQKPELKPNVQS